MISVDLLRNQIRLSCVRKSVISLMTPRTKIANDGLPQPSRQSVPAGRVQLDTDTSRESERARRLHVSPLFEASYKKLNALNTAS